MPNQSNATYSTNYRVAVKSYTLSREYIKIPYLLFEALHEMQAYNVEYPSDVRNFKEWLIDVHQSLNVNYALFDVYVGDDVITIFYEHRFSCYLEDTPVYESVIKCSDENVLANIVEFICKNSKLVVDKIRDLG